MTDMPGRWRAALALAAIAAMVPMLPPFERGGGLQVARPGAAGR